MADTELLLEIGEIKGEFLGLHRQMESHESSINGLREGVRLIILDHETRENERLRTIEAQLEIVKRIMWMGMAGSLMIGGALALRLISIAPT